MMNNFVRQFLVAGAAYCACSVSHAEIAIIVHPDNPIASMTTAEVAAIYLARDERFRPIDLPEAGGLHNWFYHQLTGRDPVHVKVLWARYPNKMPPIEARSSAEAIRRVAANKRAIAYVDTRTVDSSVKVVMTMHTPAVLDRLRGPDKDVKKERFYWW
jgi:ABC-type phosphate transport system substrate-binding protein